jgi:hypothetical protein
VKLLKGFCSSRTYLRIPGEFVPIPASQLPCVFDATPSVAAIVVSGDDAERFLNAQLSRDVPAPGAAVASLAAWHDAKGRVQAVFRVIGGEQVWLLLTHASVAPQVADGLRRFVLRAKVGIEIAGDTCAIAVGDCEALLNAEGIALEPVAGARADARGVHWIRLGGDCIQLAGPATELERIRTRLGDAPLGAAELAQIRLGLPEVSAALQGQFVPQMLNLDLLDGISFDKGCYPGQEVIARTRNLGTVKRRMLRFTGAIGGRTPAPGSPLFDASGTSVGVVIRAARAERSLELLAVAQLDASKRPLALGAAMEPALKLASLPYAIAEIVGRAD